MNTHPSIRQDIPASKRAAMVWPAVKPDSRPTDPDAAENAALRAEVASLVASCSRLESEVVSLRCRNAVLRIRAAASNPTLALVVFLAGLVLGANL